MVNQHLLLGGARAATGEEVVIVLGRFPAYKELASKINAKYFQVSPELWSFLERLPGDLNWVLNKRFLDAGVKAGAKFRLASPLSEAVAPSYYKKEIEYLASKGYHVSKDGKWMLPP